MDTDIMAYLLGKMKNTSYLPKKRCYLNFSRIIILGKLSLLCHTHILPDMLCMTVTKLSLV